jgi:hypothetical protein
MINICFSLFVTGMLMGSGPCLLNCGPILLGYISGTKSSALQGFKCWLTFSLAKFSSIIVLSFLAGVIGTALFQRFYWEVSGYIIWGLTGLFVILLGFMVSIGLNTKLKVCNILGNAAIQRDRNSVIILGILVGFLPCVPLIGVLSYITMIATQPYHGIFMGASFGLGVIISPLIFASMIAGAIPKLKILQKSNRLIIFQKVCGAILIVLGAHIFIKTTMEFISLR